MRAGAARHCDRIPAFSFRSLPWRHFRKFALGNGQGSVVREVGVERMAVEHHDPTIEAIKADDTDAPQAPAIRLAEPTITLLPLPVQQEMPQIVDVIGPVQLNPAWVQRAVRKRLSGLMPGNWAKNRTVGAADTEPDIIRPVFVVAADFQSDFQLDDRLGHDHRRT